MDHSQRKENILKKINIKGEGLELGPLCWPILSRKEANVKYVDHVNRDKLIEIYKDDKGVPAELIPEVDFPLNGRSLRDSIPKNKKYDYIIASHVIEHVPDMIRWFRDLNASLKVGGIVSLAIPDKRFTFDIDRNPSTPGDVVGAYLDEYVRPSSATLFDYASKFRSKIDAHKVWDGELYLTSKAPHRYSNNEVLSMCAENKGQYVDTHCFVFTPYSFFEIIRKLIELELLDFKVASFTDTQHGTYEFLVSLEKTGPKKDVPSQLKTIPKVKREPLNRELLATIETLKRDLKHSQHELNHIINSKSWQMTRPIRHGVRVAKNIKKK